MNENNLEHEKMLPIIEHDGRRFMCLPNRTEMTFPDGTITVVRVYSKNGSASFHAISFIRIQDDKIASVDEYWADDGAPPQWRQKMKIGRPIK